MLPMGNLHHSRRSCMLGIQSILPKTQSSDFCSWGGVLWDGVTHSPSDVLLSYSTSTCIASKVETAVCEDDMSRLH